MTRGPKSRTVRVAICQIVCLSGDRWGNFVRIENALREAAQARVDVACFPETAILGWVYSEAHRRSAPIPGPDSDRLCALAQKCRVFICIGLAEKEGDRLYDAAILISPEGRILLKHRKINILAGLMNPPYAPGREIRTVDTELGRIGVLICADTFQAENLQAMRVRQPDLVLVPYGWAAPEEKWPDHGKDLHKVVQSTAHRAEAPVVAVNSVGQIIRGPWRDRLYGGQSRAVDKTGRILAMAADRDRDVKVVDMALDN